MAWKDKYNTLYPRPLHLRPTPADQRIINRIRAHLARRARPARDSDVLRAALRAWNTISEGYNIGGMGEIETRQDQDQDQDQQNERMKP